MSLDLSQVLPAVNAALNGFSALLLTSGYLAVRRGNRNRHARLMLGATGSSGVFLLVYLIGKVLHGTTPYGGEGPIRLLYFVILGTHLVLAMAIVPLAVLLLWRALHGQFDAHRRLARWALPVWLYVSLTGVIIYVMLRPYY